MRKVVIAPNVKGIEALAIKEMEPRQPGPNEVRVEMHAASINYKDLVTVQRGVAQALIPGSDGAGRVAEVGPGVTDLKPGDRVVGLFFPLWQGGTIDRATFDTVRGQVPFNGMLAQSVTGRADGFIKFPDCLSYEEAATLPCAGLTAWNAVCETGKLQPGETLLILGTGGVALFALQFAKTIGARVIVLSGSDNKRQQVTDLGADEWIDYKKTPDWETVVLEKTDGQGVDLVLELGGVGTLARSMAATRIAGRISMVGVLSGIEGSINPMPIIRKSLSVNGIYVGSRAMHTRLHAFLETHRIKPVVDRTFCMDEIQAAIAFMQQEKHVGKIVIDLKAP